MKRQPSNTQHNTTQHHTASLLDGQSNQLLEKHLLARERSVADCVAEALRMARRVERPLEVAASRLALLATVRGTNKKS